MKCNLGNCNHWRNQRPEQVSWNSNHVLARSSPTCVPFCVLTEHLVSHILYHLHQRKQSSFIDTKTMEDMLIGAMVQEKCLQTLLLLLRVELYKQVPLRSIDGLFKVGEVQHALQLFDEMFERGISPNTMTYTAVLLGHCQANRTDDAHRLLLVMKKNNCYPDTITYNALLNGFCKLGQMDEAFMLLRSIPYPYQGSHEYSMHFHPQSHRNKQVQQYVLCQDVVGTNMSCTSGWKSESDYM